MIMLDTNHFLSFEPAPLDSVLMGEELDKQNLRMDYERQTYHSLKEVLQLKLQQRRTREELVSQGIMPPLKSPAAFHEQRRSLERARTEDYLKRKIRSRPERSELAKQLQLKRARLADDLNDKISHRPGPIELIHKNILPAAGESSLDEDSSDAFSPDTLANHDSPLGPLSQLSPSDMLTQNRDMSPSQVPPPPPPPLLVNGQDSLPPQRLTNGTAMSVASRPATGQTKSKPSSERPLLRPKKAKDNKPKVKKLKYHQYIPPDQKADREPPPQLDSTYAKILHQQQLFLQLQILHQQQQHYNYHTILPAPPKPPAEQPPSTNPGPSLLRSVPPTTPAPSNQNGSSRQSQTPVGGAKPLTLPANLDDFKTDRQRGRDREGQTDRETDRQTDRTDQNHNCAFTSSSSLQVAELKQELKLRCLTVSGTKMDLIERLRNYQEQNSGGRTGVTATVSPKPSLPTPSHASTQPAGSTSPAPPQAGTNPHTHQSEEAAGKIPAFSLAQSATPACIMRFGSTSSSPPVSPTPSEWSLVVMSPDETSCNGDVFGEMVSSPLTQLSLHPSPASIKEENQGHLSTCSLSQSRPSPTAHQPAAPPQEPLAGATMEASPLDKDQMLQEKDKQIEELTRMLRQKQRLVETLRSQLEQGKHTGAVREMEGVQDLVVNGYAQEAQTSTILHPSVTRVKEEVETEEGLEGVGKAQPTQCSQQSLLKLQQIHRIQVTPVFISQQNGTQVPAQTFSLDLLKSGATPTLVTDGNGNHYLIALTNNSAEGQHGVTSLGKTSGSQRITLQKVGLHLETNGMTNGVPETSQSVSAPPNLHPFFDEVSNLSESQSTPPPSLKREVCPTFDRHTLFTPPSPKQTSFSSTQLPKENGLSSQQMDDLFDILLKSGEISGFRANPDPSLAQIHSNPPTPPSSPLHISPPTPPPEPSLPALPSEQPSPSPCTGSDRLEDFLESTTGTDGGLTLIDDLHSQMLSTSSILDHPPSPVDMDTSDLGFSPHPAGLDFGDPALDSMDWLDISMGGGGGGTSLAPLGPHTPPSVFSADFLDSSDLTLHWDSCL
ncbi:unnamed protein product [Coregonus sp. 'balchen']|nr:unnamed protein product [Coregonus sp. 'balchen']